MEHKGELEELEEELEQQGNPGQHPGEQKRPSVWRKVARGVRTEPMYLQQKQDKQVPLGQTLGEKQEQQQEEEQPLQGLHTRLKELED